MLTDTVRKRDIQIPSCCREFPIFSSVMFIADVPIPGQTGEMEQTIWSIKVRLKDWLNNTESLRLPSSVTSYHLQLVKLLILIYIQM